MITIGTVLESKDIRLGHAIIVDVYFQEQQKIYEVMSLKTKSKSLMTYQELSDVYELPDADVLFGEF